MPGQRVLGKYQTPNMLMRTLINLSLCFAFIANSLLWTGCSGLPMGEAPERKKMLDLTSGDNDGECNYTSLQTLAATNNAFPYSVQQVGNMLTVSLPENAYDSMAINTLEQVKPFALPLLMQWAQQRKGITLNLSGTGSHEQQRVEYRLESPGMPAIPVVLLYDRWSSGRAATVLQLVRSVPGLQCRAAMGYETLDNQLRHSK